VVFMGKCELATHEGKIRRKRSLSRKRLLKDLHATPQVQAETKFDGVSA
jgi:hypothetical protein